MSSGGCPEKSNHERLVRKSNFELDGGASPGGRRVAVVVRHVYGPEDVLVLESEAEGVPLGDVPDYGLTQLLQDLHAADLVVEGTGMKVDYGFGIDGSRLLVDDQPVVYAFANVATAEEAAASVTADAGSVTVTRTEEDLVREQHSDWFVETPHAFKKGRLIVIARDHPEVLRAPENILGPQFAGG